MKMLDDSRYHSISFDPHLLSQYLSPHTPRHQHILGVVRCMKTLLSHLHVPDVWKPALLQACYLHDIGYSPQLSQYQFHPLDGAIFAYQKGFSKPVIAAVLFHSCAFEQVQQTRPDLMDIYQENFSLLNSQDQFFIDQVTFCDLHTSSTGQDITFPERLQEVIDRYGSNHEVSKLMLANRPLYEKIIERVNALIETR